MSRRFQAASCLYAKCGRATETREDHGARSAVSLSTAVTRGGTTIAASGWRSVTSA